MVKFKQGCIWEKIILKESQNEARGYLSPNEYEDKYWKELKALELIAG